MVVPMIAGSIHRLHLIIIIGVVVVVGGGGGGGGVKQPSKRRQPKTHSTHTVECVRNYNTGHNTNYKTTQGPLWAP
jgi:hypothetical protein